MLTVPPQLCLPSLSIPRSSPAPAAPSVPSPTCRPSKSSASPSTPVPIFSLSVSFSTRWPPVFSRSLAIPPAPYSTRFSTKTPRNPFVSTRQSPPNSSASLIRLLKRTVIFATALPPICKPTSSASSATLARGAPSVFAETPTFQASQVPQHQAFLLRTRQFLKLRTRPWPLRLRQKQKNLASLCFWLASFCWPRLPSRLSSLGANSSIPVRLLPLF